MTRPPRSGQKQTIKSSLEMMKAIIDINKGQVVEKKKRKAPVRTKTKNEMIEKELERQIIFALQRAGYVTYKTGSAGAYDYNAKWNPDGCADLIVWGQPNGCVLLEVKQPNRRCRKDGGLTGKQPQFRDLMGQLGVKYCVVYSVREALESVK